MPSVQEMSDRFEIGDLVTAYCHAIDNRDWDRLANLFTPDAEIDYTATGGISGGLTEITAFLEQTIPLFRSTQHFVSNLQLTLDGDDAQGRSILFNPVTLDRDRLPHTFFVGAWYVDTFTRTAAGWRIASRRQELAFFHNQ